MSELFEDEINEVPPHCRFSDLREAKIVDSWPQLRRLQDEEGFPLGYLVSPNIRVWTVASVTAWLKSRPTERKRVKRKEVAA
jgi:hypothetical protein